MTGVLIRTFDLFREYRMGGSAVVRALSGVSLTVCRSEFVAIMGPSGSGKSTLMNLLGCLDRPARALVIDPLLLLADEPTGALDSRTGLEIMALFQALNRAGRTVILVTHDPYIARHARRIVAMRDGRIVGDQAVPAPLDAAAELAVAQPCVDGPAGAPPAAKVPA